MSYNKCLKRCRGIYADVKKSPVEIVQAAQFQILMNDYLNYTWFQNDIASQTQDLIGDISSSFLE